MGISNKKPSMQCCARYGKIRRVQREYSITHCRRAFLNYETYKEEKYPQSLFLAHSDESFLRNTEWELWGNDTYSAVNMGTLLCERLLTWF